MTPSSIGATEFALWSDEPSPTDLLSFGAVASTVTDALLDERLNPVALGLSGAWGSGKTTVLGLVHQELAARNSPDATVIVVPTDPWRYDPATGAKESLISEVLDRLSNEVERTEDKGDKAKKLVKRLVGRVNWSKAIQLAARTTLALQLPRVEDLFGLINDDNRESDAAPRGMDGFRDEFSQLMSSDELRHVRRVVVLVDDLDRCLPRTVIETLEAIRLFLAVPGMSFVLAADEERVAEAIRTEFPKPTGGDGQDGTVEEPARLYLHKIVQTTIPLPALSRFDTHAYLLLLQLQARLPKEQLAMFADQCQTLRLESRDLDDLPGLDGVEITEELAFSARLTPLLYEKLRGSPRRVKRFLNDLHVRQGVASRRGINLDPGVVAKLMVLEVLLPDEFTRLLDWLAAGKLREQLDALEVAAGRPAEEDATGPDVPAAEAHDADENTSGSAPTEQKPPEFPDALVRWAKLPPPLRGVDLASYLYLAAAFQGKPLLDAGLPERLRDIAANLLSSERADQKSVTDEYLSALTSDEARLLVQHLRRMGRDRPSDQRKAVLGIKRIALQHPDTTEEAKRALLAIPPDEVGPATPLLFKLPADIAYRPVLEHWRDRSSREPVRTAATEALRENPSH